MVNRVTHRCPPVVAVEELDGPRLAILDDLAGRGSSWDPRFTEGALPESDVADGDVQIAGLPPELIKRRVRVLVAPVRIKVPAQRRAQVRDRSPVAPAHQRSCTFARKYLSYRPSIASSSACERGGRAAASAFCRACSVLRAPGITVVTPGC